MGLLLAVSKIYVPAFIRRLKLEMLFDATADAFQVTAPSVKGLSYDECMQWYAQFTREQADKAIQQCDDKKVKSRLWQNAFRIGQQFKADFNINTSDEIMQMGALIYKLIQIDFQGTSVGDIEIKRCFFSTYYSKKVCRLISSLDEGLLAGLSGGGKLCFSQRITEGNECCRAYLDMPEKFR